MTEQEIFDTVLAHLRKQGKASTNHLNGCRYRGEGGTACAVGCLIPEELYDPVIEGLVVEQLLGADSLPSGDKSHAHKILPIIARIEGRLGAEHLKLLKELQDAHDMSLSLKGLPAWEEEMRQIASWFNLAYK